MNACWSGCRWSPSAANPSMVTIWASWCATASARQLLTRRASSKMVQAPHCPWSQPFLAPGSPSRSRSTSRSVVRVSTKSRCVAPFTCKVISRSIVYVSPLVLLVTSRRLDKHWLQKSESHIVISEHVGGARRAFPHSKAHPGRVWGHALSDSSVRRKRHESVMSNVNGQWPEILTRSKFCQLGEMAEARQRERWQRERWQRLPSSSPYYLSPGQAGGCP